MVLDKNSPGLESGGDASAFDINDPAEQELEALFDKLQKNPTERKMLRESYIPRGARQELVDFLKSKVGAPSGQVVVSPQASQEKASTPPEQAPQTTQAPPTNGEAPKRGRGRPSKEEMAARQAAQQAAAQEHASVEVEAEQVTEEKPKAEEKQEVPQTLNLTF
jgi:hypothetical protein